jgi:dTDP-4-dehydrorhamnose reductase
MDILVTGGSGQLGAALCGHAGDHGLVLHAPPRSELDLADPASILRVLESRAFAGVINGGAYTAVDRAESEPANAWAVNAVAPGVIARWAAARKVPLIQVSTDYVYPGTGEAAHVETDAIGPLSVYGASKAAGELAVLASGARAVIARTSWVVSPWGANFVKTMLRLGAERETLSVVADQHGAPTSAEDMAEALLAIMARLIRDPDAPTGVYHVANSGETTWFGVAEAVFEAAAARGRKTPGLVPITTADYPTPARRPPNSRLSGDKLAADYGLRLPDWRASLTRIVERLTA